MAHDEVNSTHTHTHTRARARARATESDQMSKRLNKYNFRFRDNFKRFVFSAILDAMLNWFYDFCTPT